MSSKRIRKRKKSLGLDFQALEPKKMMTVANLPLEIDPSKTLFAIEDPIVIDRVMYFAGIEEGGVEARNLYRVDVESTGTASNLINLSDNKYQGAPGGKEFHPTNLTNVNGTLFFRANDGQAGYELWKSDGTVAGTVRVQDINPGSEDGLPSYTDLANINGTLFFGANDGVNGFELWRSDGTPSAGSTNSDTSISGTVLVKDINSMGDGLRTDSASLPGSPEGFENIYKYRLEIVNMNGIAYFAADNGAAGFELWRSDGRDTGTAMVEDLDIDESSFPTELTNVNGWLVFAARSEGFLDPDQDGFELWKTDGIGTNLQGTTVQLTDLNQNIEATIEAIPRDVTNVSGQIFFSGQDATSGGNGPPLNPNSNSQSLFKSDGTEFIMGSEDAYSPVKVVGPTVDDDPQFTNVNGTLFFRDSGSHLWKVTSQLTPYVDGNVTTQYWEMTLAEKVQGVSNNGQAFDVTTLEIGNLVNANGVLYYASTDPPTDGVALEAGEALLWRTNGLTEGTRDTKVATGIVDPNNPIPFILPKANVNGWMFFSAGVAEGAQADLWRIDRFREPATPVLVPDENADEVGHPVIRPEIQNPHQVRFDGVPVVIPPDVTGGITPEDNYNITQDGDKVGFQVPGAAPEDLVRLVPQGDGLPTSTANFTNVNGLVFFTGVTPQHGNELWVTDGTVSGTRIVKDLNPGAADSDPNELTNMDGRLFFTATAADENNNGKIGLNLLTSDASASGTQVIALANTVVDQKPAYLTNVEGHLFFSGTGTTGRELYRVWWSEGQPLPLSEYREINSDPVDGSNPALLTNVNGTLMFRANDGLTGNDLWKAEWIPDSSTSELSVELVKNLRPNDTGDPSLRHLTNVNGRLFFQAKPNAYNGRRLWVSDGTTGNTVLVKNATGQAVLDAADLTNVRGLLFFTGRNFTASSRSLWVSDAASVAQTNANTVQHIFAVSAASSEDPTDLLNVHGTLFFTAKLGDGSNGLFELEVMVDGGDLQPAVQLAVDPADASQWDDFAAIEELTNVNGNLHFMSNSLLWKVVDHEIQLVDAFGIEGLTGANNLVNANGNLFFSGSDSTSSGNAWVLTDIETQQQSAPSSGVGPSISTASILPPLFSLPAEPDDRDPEQRTNRIETEMMMLPISADIKPLVLSSGESYETQEYEYIDGITRLNSKENANFHLGLDQLFENQDIDQLVENWQLSLK